MTDFDLMIAHPPVTTFRKVRCLTLVQHSQVMGVLPQLVAAGALLKNRHDFLEDDLHESKGQAAI